MSNVENTSDLLASRLNRLLPHGAYLRMGRIVHTDLRIEADTERGHPEARILSIREGGACIFRERLSPAAVKHLVALLVGEIPSAMEDVPVIPPDE